MKQYNTAQTDQRLKQIIIELQAEYEEVENKNKQLVPPSSETNRMIHIDIREDSSSSVMSQFKLPISTYIPAWTPSILQKRYPGVSFELRHWFRKASLGVQGWWNKLLNKAANEILVEAANDGEMPKEEVPANTIRICVKGGQLAGMQIADALN